MKTLIPNLFLALAWLALPTLAQAQFSFTTNNGAITITGYNTAAGLNVFIPAATNGFPVTSIGNVAFIESSITTVTIPNSVTSIGTNAFFDCTSLTNITVIAGNPDYSSMNGVLFNQNQTMLIQFPAGLGGSYTITNSVTSIGDEAFDGCSSLTNVTIPGSVTSIGDYAFAVCTNLTSVTIGNSATSIGFDAFAVCTSLTSVTIPNSVTSIGAAAFGDCTSLTSVTIGNSVTSIGEGAFVTCLSLTSVTIPNSVTSIGDDAFFFCASLKSAYFQGNAPPDNGDAFSDDPATVYYLYGTTGWGPTFGSVPTALWNPQANTLGFTGGHFGFNLTGPTNAVIVVEACTNLSHPVWLPVATNTFSGSGTSTFSDLQSGAHPTRFYRERSP